jgi:hypothetical protein
MFHRLFLIKNYCCRGQSFDEEGNLLDKKSEDPMEVAMRKQISDACNKQDEYEAFIGTKIPNEVKIHPPNDIKSKGRCKRIKKRMEIMGRTKHVCGSCKQKGEDDARNCPSKVRHQG